MLRTKIKCTVEQLKLQKPQTGLFAINFLIKIKDRLY